MVTAKAPKVVSTVKRAGDAPLAHKRSKSKKAPAVKAAAKASRKAAVAPLLKKKPAASVVAPVVKRETPHILKSTEGKPLVDRLNAKLLEQLRTRKVTNEETAALLDVHPTYLSRVLKEMGEEKAKGITMAHREARAKLAHTREQYRAQLAKKVNRKELTPEQAAKQANCTVRTMFRWMAQYGNVK